MPKNNIGHLPRSNFIPLKTTIKLQPSKTALSVIRVDDHGAYLVVLEAASVENDIRPFAQFVAKQVWKAIGSEASA